MKLKSGKEEWRVLSDLFSLEDDWARALARAKPDGGIRASMRSASKGKLGPKRAVEAEEHLAAAETWMKQVASFATSGSEGSVAMHEVYELQFARVWMLLTAVDKATASAREICSGLEQSSENLEGNQRRELAKLQSMLGSRPRKRTGSSR